ncbi:MAG: response regulator [Myxococcales bacterium]|nr:response regulator [Myxococcales bacterium]
MRILILDDNKSYGDLLASACKKLGHLSTALQGPRKALNFLKEEQVDALLVDLEMPEMMGTVFSALVREQGFDVPIAICTGSCVDEELTAQAEVMGPRLPRIWTHADLRSVLRSLQLGAREPQDGADSTEPSAGQFPEHDWVEEVTQNDMGSPQAVRDLAKGTGATPKESIIEGEQRIIEGEQSLAQQAATLRAPTQLQSRSRRASKSQVRKTAPRIHVRCSNWEQVRKLCTDVMSGLTSITVRAQANLGHGQVVILALALPDEMVVSIEAEIAGMGSAGPDGRHPYQLNMVGFGNDELTFLQERCDENKSTADDRPSLPESMDSVDIQHVDSYAPRISWD